MKAKEILVRKTLDFLLEHAKIKDLNLITIAIQDYEEEGYDLNSYREKINKLREAYNEKI